MSDVVSSPYYTFFFFFKVEMNNNNKYITIQDKAKQGNEIQIKIGKLKIKKGK